MGNKTSLCSRENKMSAFNDSYQSTSVSSSLTISNSLKKSFANGQISKDNFKILKVVGRGSFGKVFLVEKKKFGTTPESRKESQQYYAMKVLKKSNLLERNQIDHTKTEREVL